MSKQCIPHEELVEVVEGAIEKSILEEALEEDEKLSEVEPEAGARKGLPATAGGASFAPYMAEGLPDGLSVQELLEPTALILLEPNPIQYRATEDLMVGQADTPEEPQILIGTEFQIFYIIFIYKTFVFPLVECGHWVLAEIAIDLFFCEETPSNDVLEGGDLGDFIAGLTGNDLLIGNGGDDLIFGNQGCDTLTGNGGDDTLLGGDGADLIEGGEGDDLLYGGGGCDRLFGQDGFDSLYGESGADVFAFTSIEEGHDIILDYSIGDQINLDQLFDKLIEDGLALERTYELEVSPEDAETKFWQPKDYILTVVTDTPNDFSIVIQDVSLLERWSLDQNIIITDGDYMPM